MSENSSETVLSITEAARRLGVTEDAIRKRIRRGQLQTRRVNHARGIHVVLPASPQSPRDCPGRPEWDEARAAALVREIQAALDLLRAALDRQETEAGAALQKAVATLNDQLTEKDRQLAAKDQQIAELHDLVSDLSKTLAAMESKRPHGLVPCLRVLLFGPASPRTA